MSARDYTPTGIFPYLRVTNSYGPLQLQDRGDVLSEAGTFQANALIASVSNTTPIVITTQTTHYFASGDQVQVADSTVTAANGAWTITVLTGSMFQLDLSTAGGAGGSVGGCTAIQRGTLGKLIDAVDIIAEDLGLVANQTAGPLAIPVDISMLGDLSVDGVLVCQTTLTVVGSATVETNLLIEGSATVDTDLAVIGTITSTGLTTCNGGLNVTGTCAITGAATVSTTLGVTGQTTVTDITHTGVLRASGSGAASSVRAVVGSNADEPHLNGIAQDVIEIPTLTADRVWEVDSPSDTSIHQILWIVGDIGTFSGSKKLTIKDQASGTVLAIMNNALTDTFGSVALLWRASSSAWRLLSYAGTGF